MTTAVQTPFRAREAKQLGGRLFRKQVLPFTEVVKDGRRLVFDEDYCRRLVDSFNGGVFPQVPFVLVDPATNRHTEDPERWRGEVKGFELSGDGLDAIVELSEGGAQLIRDNPGLGVSVRILEDVERADGRRCSAAIKHVAGTLDPEIGSLRDWEDLSDLSAGYGESRVVDLTAARYSDDMPETFTDEEVEKLRKLLADGGKEAANTPSADANDGKEAANANANANGDANGDKPEKPAEGSPQQREQEVLEQLAALYRDHPELAGEEKPEPTAAGAELSADAKRQIDLAAEQAKRASDEAAELRRQLVEKDFLAERRAYVEAGVPSSALDLAASALRHRGVIDLSHDEKVDVGQIVRGLLDHLKGTVDLSREAGSSTDEPEAAAAAAHRKAMHDEWDKRYGKPGARRA